MSAIDDQRTEGHTQLQDAFATPRWLRDLGRSSWLLVGVLLLVIGLIWLLAETYTIVGPMVCALIVAVVAMPSSGSSTGTCRARSRRRSSCSRSWPSPSSSS